MNKKGNVHNININPSSVSSNDLLNFHDRAIVHLSSPNSVVNETEENHTNRSDNAEVHSLNSDNPRWRPETEEDGNSHVDERKGIDQNAPDAWQVEWSPHKLCTDSVDDGGIAASGIADATSAASPEK
jgi:hypothetical protein